MKLIHSFHVFVIIIDVMLSTCTPPTSVVKVIRFNFSYSYYTSVGGATGHTVVCSFVCVCVFASVCVFANMDLMTIASEFASPVQDQVVVPILQMAQLVGWK